MTAKATRCHDRVLSTAFVGLFQKDARRKNSRWHPSRTLPLLLADRQTPLSCLGLVASGRISPFVHPLGWRRAISFDGGAFDREDGDGKVGNETPQARSRNGR